MAEVSQGETATIHQDLERCRSLILAITDRVCQLDSGAPDSYRAVEWGMWRVDEIRYVLERLRREICIRHLKLVMSASWPH